MFVKELENVFKKSYVKTFLHSILTNEESIHLKSSFAPNGEAYVTNQNTLFIFIEFIVKYAILHKDLYQIDSFIDLLGETYHSLSSEHDDSSLILSLNQLLLSSVKERLELSDATSLENKKKILEYTYQEYIVNGYFFTSFPSYLTKQVLEDGVYPRDFYPFPEEQKNVSRILSRYVSKETLLSDPLNYFMITDSPYLAYLDAITSPRYFSYLVCFNSYMKKDLYDYNAFYMKNFVSCASNIFKLCHDLDMPLSEQQVVTSYVKKTCELLENDFAFVPILFISRKAVGRDSLRDYNIILKDMNQQDLIYSFARIVDSRFPHDRRYTKILPFEFTLLEFPTYESIFYLDGKRPDMVERFVKEDISSKNNLKRTVKKERGSIHFILISCFFLIVLVLALVLAVYFVQGSINI